MPLRKLLPPIPPGAPMFGGAPQPWDIGETMSLAFEGFKRSWGVLVGSYLLVFVVSTLPRLAPTVLVMLGVLDRGSALTMLTSLFFALIGFAIQCFFQTGLIKIWLAVARGQAPNFSDLFSGGNLILVIFATLFLVGVVSGLGFILLIVPGVILALGLMFAQFFVVDAGMGPIAAMKASWQITNGHKGKLFLLVLVGIPLTIVGLIACCVGVFAAVSIVFVAQAIVFVRLSGRGTTSAGYAMPGDGGYGGPPGYPGGYYGAPQGGGGPPRGY